MWPWETQKIGLPPDKCGSSSNSNPPDGIRKINDSVYALHDPPRGPPEIEIVFIHGLQLCEYKKAYWRAWIVKENDKDGREICWPMVWLGEEFPKARIMSVKYDSCIERTDTSGRMDGFLLGESLVQEMVEMAKIGQTKNCPILFVCHCIGGLVVKEIVIQAPNKSRNEAMYSNFLKNIRGFHFYATPHQGSKLADMWALAPNMGQMVAFVKVINKELGRRNAKFERIQRDCYSGIWCFKVVAETHYMSYHEFSGMVVEEASARHVYDTVLSLGDDHFGVCKPSDKVSTSYLSLKNFIASIVARAKKERKDELEDVPDFVVGMDNKVKEVCGLLEGHCMVGLVGMGGVGKTTLSKYVFNEQIEKEDFERYCFLEDVKMRGITGIEGCQRELFRGSCGDRWNENENVKFHLEKIKGYITSMKVLLVIDDVGDEANMEALQVDAFQGGKSGSKVIVTSRRHDIMLGFVAKEGIIDVKLLDENQAFELFSHYAFSGIDACVKVEFRSKAWEIVKTCGELPLSLEVIGRFLKRKWKNSDIPIKAWDDALERLKDAKPFDGSNDDKKLWARLRISFDDLGTIKRGIFLDMACIMYNRHAQMMAEKDSEMLCKSTFEEIWKLEYSGIKNLTDSSLIKWSGKRRTLVIHEQLRDMVRSIVKAEVDANKSRVWDSDVGLEFLLQRKGSRNLEGLFLGGIDELVPKFKGLKNSSARSFDFGAVECFESLRLLNIPSCGEDVVQYFIRLSTKKLIWASLNGSHVTEESIRELNHLKGLKALCMRSCNQLIILPTDIKNLSSLMKLDLSWCEALKRLPEEFGGLRSLKF